jgi:hypothetical protein
MAKAKAAASKKSSSKRKAKEPIVEIDGIEIADNSASNERSEPATPAEPAPNIVWRGEKEPPAAPKIGMNVLSVPDADLQRAGFYLEPWQARRLVIAIPGYKFLKPKG